jgi:hypothetical protein
MSNFSPSSAVSALSALWRFLVNNGFKLLFAGLITAAILYSAIYLAFFNSGTYQELMIGLVTVVALGLSMLLVLGGVPVNWPTGLAWGVASFLCGAVLGLMFGIPRAPETPQSGNGNAPTAEQRQNASVPGAQPAAPSAGGAGGSVNGAAPDNSANASPAPGGNSVQPAGQTADTQNAPKQTAPRIVYQPNTGLDLIADWLTKIVIGVTLVQLPKIRDQLKVAARFMSVGLASGVQGKTAADFTAIALAIIVGFATEGFISSYLLTRVWLPQLFVSY